jgi:hypothetical protein
MKNNIKYVWCAQYCSSIYEGGLVDLAICSTRKKAREVLAAHKKDDWFHSKRNKDPIPKWMIWRITKREVI